MKPLIVQPDEGKVFNLIEGDRCTYRVTADFTEGKFSMIEQTVPVGHGARKHVHTREDEAFCVFEGTFTFEVANDRYEVGKGGFVLGPRHIPHSFRNTGTSVGKLWIMFVPSGLENFFAEYSEVLNKYPGNIQKQNECAERYGITFVA